MDSNTFLGEEGHMSISYEKFIDFADLKSLGFDLSGVVSSQKWEIL